LRSFYAAAFLSVSGPTGAIGTEAIDDGEWPEEPEEGDMFDLSMIPQWLRYILLVDNVLEWGLDSVTSRVWSGQCTAEVRYELRGLFIEDIPTRELDDPPDSEATDSCRSGIIEEFSSINIEDNISSDT
jgi:hypothetical protein